tara:strand:- start:850 stop:1713 length:864 start_codon:yes stop_codon:yes gene_type:complete
MKKDAYQIITDQILELMEKHGTDWNKPWKSTGSTQPSMPWSIGSGDNYKGINTLLLWSAGYTDQRFGTYKAWKDKGAQVRKGEKSTVITFWKMLETRNKETGEKENFPMLRTFNVFNAEQCVNVPELVIPEPLPELERNAIADTFIANTGADIRTESNRAYFVPSHDFIALPEMGAFSDSDSYYGTLLHELTHWTGHKDRLARTFGKSFGDNEYAKEELVAELGSVFLCVELQVTAEPRADHAKYLNSWIKGLKDDKKMIIQASSKASKAVEYLKELQETEQLQAVA